MEDVGLEKWDYRLNRDLFGSEAVDSVDKVLAVRVQQQLTDCKTVFTS